MSTTETPLRYPGGKSQLAPFVTDLLRANDLLGGVYGEPFAGGAGLAWRLLLAGRVSEVWLNDIDPAIYAFWHSVLYRTDDLCELVETTPIDLEQWERQRTIHSKGSSNLLRLGFAAFFLNRTNRSGIITGGIIGGKGQAGTYKIDCRFGRQGLVEKIRRIGSYRDVVTLTRIDARLCIPQWAKRLPTRSLLNIDPPYYIKGYDLYTNFYTPENHRDLAKLIRRLRCSWMLTYDDVPQVLELYRGLPVYRKGLTYSAQVKRRADELLVLSPRLAAPNSLIGDAVAAA